MTLLLSKTAIDQSLESLQEAMGSCPQLQLLTFTPSVDTAERDLPMHGGSNP
jgi:hypothetical protein